MRFLINFFASHVNDTVQYGSISVKSTNHLSLRDYNIKIMRLIDFIISRKN